VTGEHEWEIAEFRAKVHAVGERWTGARPTWLTELLRAAAGGDPELTRAGGQLLEDFVEGVARIVAAPRPSLDLAADLVDGRQLPSDVVDRLANAYVTVLARPEVERRDDPLVEHTGHGVLCTKRSGVLVLLVPDGETAVLARIIERLGAECWVATARRPVAELSDAYTEAADVLRLVVAGRRPAGVYTIADVLVEHAVMCNEAVAARLASLIRPLRNNEMLWQTLVALIKADFNRNEAARKLYIHRSTMDYRLRRISKITGHDLARIRNAQLLCMALIAEAMV